MPDMLEVFARRQNALRTDEAANLEEEREERGEIDEAEGTQKEPAGDQAIGRTLLCIRTGAEEVSDEVGWRGGHAGKSPMNGGVYFGVAVRKVVTSFSRASRLSFCSLA